MTLKMLKKIHQTWSGYDLGEISDIKSIPGGLINETYQITNNKNNVYILQKLQRIFDQGLMMDIEVIADHLENRKWHCPKPLKTKEGNVSVSWNSEIWRVYKYIPGNDFSSISIGQRFYFEVGERLGMFHRDLVSLKYNPLHKIEGFHNKDFYLQKALKIEKKLYPIELQIISEELFESLEKYSFILNSHHQLIHGDPRVENILFSSKGNPFTFIDYDTFMVGSIFIDIGDCLRSLMSQDDSKIFTYRLQEFISGYSQGTGEDKIGYEQALLALKYVTLELTVRFMIDSVEQDYFFWDREIYETAADHNKARAIQNWDLFKKISKEL